MWLEYDSDLSVWECQEYDQLLASVASEIVIT